MNRLCTLTLLGALTVLVCGATVVARFSLEQMVDRSELIVIGQVTRVWNDWDGSHRYIWTHHEVAVQDVAKGSLQPKAAGTIVVSEPGGVVNGIGMRVAGAPTYAPGEQVMLFLERVPNGYLRSLGLGQGKLRISADGRVHVTHAGADAESMAMEGAPATQIRQRVARLVESAGRVR